MGTQKPVYSVDPEYGIKLHAEVSVGWLPSLNHFTRDVCPFLSSDDHPMRHSARISDSA